MATSLPLEQLVSAIPVVVGGLLAIAGGLASQLVVHKLAERRELTKLRRDRVESLIRALYAQTRWIAERSTKMMFRNEDHDEPWPLDEARLIQALYFPQLAAEIHAVHEACIPMVKFINEQRLNHMKDRDAFIKEYNSESFDTAYKSYIAAVSVLTSKCRALLNE
jgi:hypothetical protein